MFKIKSLFSKKYRIYQIIGIIVLVILVYFFFIKKDVKQELLTVVRGDFLQQVSVSGKVVASENLDLSFEQSGIISKVFAKVGDNVPAGKLLVSQDTAQLYTQLSEMQAGIDLQKAKLNQFLAGASTEDIKTKQDALNSAKQDLQDTYYGAISTLKSAYDTIYNASTVALFIQNTYFNSVGLEDIKVQSAKKGIDNNLADAKKYTDNLADQNLIDLAVANILVDLNSTYGYLKVIRDQCDEPAYYSQVSTTNKTLVDTQRTNVNLSSTSVSTLKQNIATDKAGVLQAQNELDALKAPSRITDIAVFEAQIRQAEASAQNILTQIRKRQIISPINGVVTQINAKVGSIFSLGQIATSVISSGNFEIESYVPEIYISLIKIGNTADVTLDSYGADKIFKARVASIDPSETLKDGVSTYKIILVLDNYNDAVRDGMTANVIITTAQRANTISVPQGIIISKSGQKFVKVMDGKKIVEREVVIGDYSSSGQVEIISGLQDGDVVIVK